VPDNTPVLRVVRGDATPAEIAVLVAVLAAREQGGGDAPAPTRSAWADPMLRRPLVPGPGAWRRSALPH
jgi:hypothetical protein